jgi:hypothetical protein
MVHTGCFRLNVKSLCLFLRLGTIPQAKSGGKIVLISEHFEKYTCNCAWVVISFQMGPVSKFSKIIELNTNALGK